MTMTSRHQSESTKNMDLNSAERTNRTTAKQQPCSATKRCSWKTTPLLLFVLICTVAAAQGQQTVAQCRSQCYSDYLRLYRYYCRWGSVCKYTNYMASYYWSCYRECNSKGEPFTPTTTRRPPTTNRPPGYCGQSSASRGLQPSYSVEGRLVGGSLASECEFPWAVVINIGTTFCGGTIINDNTILTAGHCVYSSSGGIARANSIKVKYGSSSQKKMSYAYVSQVLLHPKFYLPQWHYDVALLKLDRSLRYSTCVRPICMAPQGAEPANAQFCQAAGWGALSYSQPSSQVELQKVKLPIVNLNKCRQMYRSSALITDYKICAGDTVKGGMDSCLGDSGGPLQCMVNGVYYQYGVVSFGRGCGEPGYPGVYARLTYSTIYQWIMGNL